MAAVRLLWSAAVTSNESKALNCNLCRLLEQLPRSEVPQNSVTEVEMNSLL